LTTEPLSSASPSYAGLKALVMGLGLNGGGLAAALFLAHRGAEVTVTDLRDEATLAPTLQALGSLPIRTVLGRHEMADFEAADLVVKNPAVRPDSPYLAAARRVETDISLFLRECPSTLLAVTGSKGKSSVSSALHWGLTQAGKTAYLGGNITVSPLSFLDDLRPQDYVVLELSSWQLGDLKGRTKAVPGEVATALLKPRVAVLTSIMADHQDRYGGMDAYVADKRVIYQGQDGGDVTVCGVDSWGDSFAAETRGRVLRYSQGPLPAGIDGVWLDPLGSGFFRRGGGDPSLVLPQRLAVPGAHQRVNLLAAAAGLADLGMDPAVVAQGLSTFPGIEHRLEFFAESGGVRFYNDTAATIPEAAAAALDAFSEPVVLVTGGTDKALDFTPLAEAAKKASSLVLLAGTGSEKLAALLDRDGIAYRGPFSDLSVAIDAAFEAARPGSVVVLSPGCASFGMFKNEFDRGRRWKAGVLSRAGLQPLP